MRDKKQRASYSDSFGTGYATVIMLFVIITLAVLASLSFSAAGANAGQDERASEFTAAYYEAENRANEKLMKIDEAAIEAYANGLFDLFGDTVTAYDGISAVRNDEGFSVSWMENVSERVALVCEVEVYADPALHENKRYSVTEWNTVSGGSADVKINVWDGTF